MPYTHFFNLNSIFKPITGGLNVPAKVKFI